MALQRGARIDVDWCPNLFSYTSKGHVFGIERAIAKVEMVHGRALCQMSGRKSSNAPKGNHCEAWKRALAFPKGAIRNDSG